MSKSKVTKSPQEITSNWKQGMKNNVTKMQNGIRALTENPMQKAAEKAEKMKMNLVKSIDDGRWQRGLQSVDFGQWKETTAKKIGERVATGVEAATDKHMKFAQWQVNTLNSILPEIAQMADTTLEDNIARSAAFIRKMAENKYRK